MELEGRTLPVNVDCPVQKHWTRSLLHVFLCTHVGGMTLLHVVTCTVYCSCRCIMCSCRWSDIVRCHCQLYCVLVHCRWSDVSNSYVLSPVLCAHADVLCARADGVTLLRVIVNCAVCLCRWSDVTCCHLYCVLVLVYYVLVQVEWRYVLSSVLCRAAASTRVLLE